MERALLQLNSSKRMMMGVRDPFHLMRPIAAAQRNRLRQETRRTPRSQDLTASTDCPRSKLREIDRI